MKVQVRQLAFLFRDSTLPGTQAEHFACFDATLGGAGSNAAKETSPALADLTAA